MTLQDLYQQVTADEHGNIMVSGDRVFFRDKNGWVQEYILSDDQDRTIFLLREYKAKGAPT